VTEAGWSPDDADGGKSSQEADVDAGYASDDSGDDDDNKGGGLLGSLGIGGDTAGDSESGGDSHAADIDAGYDDESDSPVGNDGGLSRDS
jgi:hypothetical protein